MRGDRRSPSFWVSLFRQLRLAWRLFRDQRVSFVYKLIPTAALIYILSPIDFLPDWLIGAGQLDDLTLFVLSVQIFTRICPRAIVESILAGMDGDVIDGEWRASDNAKPAPPSLPKSDE
jgi:uncharacterized membrane protein YkvA (DUF1232 family)